MAKEWECKQCELDGYCTMQESERERKECEGPLRPTDGPCDEDYA